MPMTVAAAARAAGVSSKAVRLWEAKGLLPPAPRTAAGYRVFTDGDVAVLKCIRQAKALDLSLAEIRAILNASADEAGSCVQITGLLAARITEVDQTIAGLRGLRERLVDALDTASGCRSDQTGVCEIIEGAAGEQKGN